MKWAIYGTPFSMLGDVFQPKEEVVATFDSKESANCYIQSSKLKKKNPRYFRIYREKSLLNYYEHAEVAEYNPESPPPHNPEIDW